MINKIWTKLIILPVSLLLNSCNHDLAIQAKNNSYLIHPKNSSVEVDLRLGENKEITSFSIKDDNKNFSIMLNLLEDGNCSLKLNTSIYEETVNTDISKTSNKYINQYLVLNNKIYLLQEIDNEGQVSSEKRIKSWEE
jgi:hypothetical protein